MLVGRVLRSPYPHARLRHVDVSRARRVPGVRAVVTAADVHGERWGAFIPDQYVLATDKVRYVGEEVAAVAASDAAAAEEALSLIAVEYEPLPAVFDPLEALRPGAPVLHAERPDNVALVVDVERGDVEAALAAADCVVDETFRSCPQWQAALETIGTLAEPHADGTLTLYANQQSPFLARAQLARALGLRETAIRLIQTTIGGGFGGKQCDDNNIFVCALLALKAGRPVQLVNSREEDFLAGPRPRVAMTIRVRLGLKADGTLLAKHLETVADNGAYCGKSSAVTGLAALRHVTTLKSQYV
jgi:CO/xanthine dehydrogenase Mo-binding subunit